MDRMWQLEDKLGKIVDDLTPVRLGPRSRGIRAKGGSATTENLSGRKPELDAISVASEASQDDKCSTSVSENDSETQSVSSFSSGPSLRYPTTD
ncbi:hypothetical protein DBR06_SOUSAS29310013 [Sousa chinensis]|nr:hypothetical protein DBR06_SOUSAS29310013 [Sousa chinensis]